MKTAAFDLRKKISGVASFLLQGRHVVAKVLEALLHGTLIMLSMYWEPRVRESQSYQCAVYRLRIRCTSPFQPRIHFAFALEFGCAFVHN
jgi:hypothetical protein